MSNYLGMFQILPSLLLIFSKLDNEKRIKFPLFSCAAILLGEKSHFIKDLPYLIVTDACNASGCEDGLTSSAVVKSLNVPFEKYLNPGY